MNIHPISCGTLRVDALEMYNNLPLERIREYYHIDRDGSLRISLNALLISNNKRNILIDPGCADFLPARLQESYGLENPLGLEETIREKGIEPDQITDVLITHLHFDHGSGAFIRVPGCIKKRFQHARYWVSRTHYSYASRPDPKEEGSFFRTFLDYLDQIHWIEDWDLEWLQFLYFHGHTKEMVIPVIHTDKRKIYFASDLVPMELFLEPEVNSGYDLDPDLAAREKRSFLDELDGNSELFLFHEPLRNRVYYP